ncbi:hypothetical protein Kisp01_20710 [Kineosporia sp. NBRC 101677]|uniref:hypothetical protein n=1 Tax=Kineosporia sp. NBRC 101677 TaxID=3032197 RepID=UPI0024A0A5DD|nr:hypothetical protein [Kineosporia sp. NBRC 101677]GLY15056.1 hypothetical protein Kisp01_20710 [Kineosporia sp. NBRC 101677]
MATQTIGNGPATLDEEHEDEQDRGRRIPWLRNRLRARLRPGPTARAVSLWAAVAWIVLTLALLPVTRPAVTSFGQVYLLFVLGFLVMVTRTLRWAHLSGLFAACLVWAFAAAGLGAALLPHAGTVATELTGAALGQSVLTLAPVLVIALSRPERLRAFAVSDWLLVGLAGGLAFLAAQRTVLGLWFSPAVAHPVQVWTPLVTTAVGLAIAGWRRAARLDGASAVLLRAVSLVSPVLLWWPTVLAPTKDVGAASPALVPEWLRLGSGTLESLPLVPILVVASGLAALAALLTDARHLLAVDEQRNDLTILPTPWSAARWTKNWAARVSTEPVRVRPPATQPAAEGGHPGTNDTADTADTVGTAGTVGRMTPDALTSPTPSTAWPTVTPPSAWPAASSPKDPAPPTSQPTDASKLTPPGQPTSPAGLPEPPEAKDSEEDDDRDRARHRAAGGSGSRGSGVKAVARESLAVSKWLLARLWRALTVDVCALAAYAARDKMVILAAHAGVSGESRLTRLVRGRAAMEMARHARLEAHARRSGPARRSQLIVWRVSSGLLLVLLAAALWLAYSAVPADVRATTSLWLTGLLAELGGWWAGMTVLEQVLLVGTGVALMLLSTGYLGQGYAVSGAASFLSWHGYGAGTFVRDPRAALGTYLRSAPPAALLADAAELSLTFTPVTFAGAVEGRALRRTCENYLHTFQLGGAGVPTKAEVFAEFTARAIPPAGFHDVVLQTDLSSSGNGFNPRTVAKLILNDTDYAGGPIRLVPGAVGGTAAHAAQALADKLGVPVMAPDDTVHAFDSGRLVVGPSPLVPTGQWAVYQPQGQQ